MPKLPVDQRPRLTLEDYILFFTTRSGHGLTMDHLNQVLPTPSSLSSPLSRVAYASLNPKLIVVLRCWSRRADHLHARVHQVPPPEQAGDRGRAQQVRPHAPAPLYRQHQRGRAPAQRRQAVGRAALHGGGQGRHRGPRLARVPRRLPPLRPRRRGGALRGLHADRRHLPRLRGRGARLSAEHTQRLLPGAPRAPRAGGEAEAVQEGPGEGGHEGEEEARRAAAHAPVSRGHGGHRLTEQGLLRLQSVQGGSGMASAWFLVNHHQY